MTYAFQVSSETRQLRMSEEDLGSATGQFPPFESDTNLIKFGEKRTVQPVLGETSLEDRLIEAVAQAKRWTSRVAMRLAPDARTFIFRQLDRLHDLEEWHSGNEPIELESYKSFVRALVADFVGPNPSMALTSKGNLTAIWGSREATLLIEFRPLDRVRFLVSQPVDGAQERVAGDTSIARLPLLLAPFNTDRWFRAA